MAFFIEQGIVIQNNDPEQMGRVKIFFPNVSPSLYKNWRDSGNDLAFKFIGKNIGSDLSPILEDLKQILPWAESANPLFGEGSSGRYNAGKNFGGISDSPENLSNVAGKVLNAEGLDEKAGAKYEYESFRQVDAFGGQNSTIKGNPLANCYFPSAYSNAAKGSFTVPAVGAHVWAFFRNGDANHPIYFATSFGKEEWNGIYDVNAGDAGLDYPQDYENNPTPDLDGTRIFRHKHVISQKGGTIEFVNTDNKEGIKLTAASGAFTDLNAEGNINFSPKNRQSLILNDSFDTIRGDSLSYTYGDSERVTEGDSHRRSGIWENAVSGAMDWMKAAKTLGYIKQLFEIQRAAPSSDGLTSTLQTKVGSPALHPSGSGTSGEIRKTFTQTLLSVPYVHGHTETIGFVPAPQGIPSSAAPEYSGRQSPSTEGGMWAMETRKENLLGMHETLRLAFADAERKIGDGGNEVVRVTKSKVEVIGVIPNDLPAVRRDETGKLSPSGVFLSKSGAFTDYEGSALIEEVHVDQPPFGAYNLTIGDRLRVNVGSGGIQLSTTGVHVISGVVNKIFGKQVIVAAEDEVHVATKRLLLEAEILHFKNKKGKQIIMDGTLAVRQNAIVEGSIYVDGTVYANRIATPMEWHQTQPVQLFGKLLGGFVIGKDSLGGPVVSTDAELCIMIYPHSHPFPGPAIDLHLSSVKMREAANSAGITADNTASKAGELFNGSHVPK